LNFNTLQKEWMILRFGRARVPRIAAQGVRSFETRFVYSI